MSHLLFIKQGSSALSLAFPDSPLEVINFLLYLPKFFPDSVLLNWADVPLFCFLSIEKKCVCVCVCVCINTSYHSAL